MKYSQLFCPTLKEDPASVEVASHRLLLRAGMIRQVAAGIYDVLPVGLRVIRKIETIVRQEMNRAGAQEILMPMVQPAELWKETGRWEGNGKELLRFKDRNERDFCLGPTHEEVVTDLVRREIRSYKQLPVNLYQIQTKFRDEIRPRFGLMRGREFSMKDAYSFDVSLEGMQESYRKMKVAYENIFRRCGLQFRSVQADSGNIGGSQSEEFMVLAQSGEDEVAHCPNCGYAANTEKAQSSIDFSTLTKEVFVQKEKKETPNQKTIEQVASFLGIDPDQTLKVLLYHTEKGIAAAVLPGNRELSEIQFQRALGVSEFRPLAPAELKGQGGVEFGSIGPIDLKKAIPGVTQVLFDTLIHKGRAYCVGANENGFHWVGAVAGKDFLANDEPYNLHKVAQGDRCMQCDGGMLEVERGIEVGHIFALGTKYSKAMNCVFTDENGKEKPMEMGCYGVGVSRTAQAAVEQNFDDKGIVFPPAIAPFEVVIDVVKWKDETLQKHAVELYQTLLDHGFDVLLDDRDVSIGVKLKDAELLGIPARILVGHKGIEQQQLEVKMRWAADQHWISPSELVSWLKENLEKGIDA
ncbi:MAG: proline--tRNA ligase [Bdellovibrionota bacterium]